MGTMDVKTRSGLKTAGAVLLTKNLDKYHSNDNAIGLYRYNNAVINYLSNTSDAMSYRIAVVGRVLIKEIKKLNITGNDDKTINPEAIICSFGNKDLIFVKSFDTNSIDNIGYSIVSDVASRSEKELNNKRVPFKTGDALYALWTIYQSDGIDGVLVGFFKSERDAISFYENAASIEQFVEEWELAE
jgi:hypothetical protein